METSASLLERLRTSPDEAAWRRLDDLYRPLIRHWLLRDTSLREEVDDLVQEIMGVLIREVPGFRRRRAGSFRAWLRQVTVHRMRAFYKARWMQPQVGGGEADSLLVQLADPTSDLSRQWDQDHDKHVCQQLLAIVRPDFEAPTWQAFTRLALEGQPTARVAEELAMSETAVTQAKFRILKRLREEAGELLD